MSIHCVDFVSDRPLFFPSFPPQFRLVHSCPFSPLSGGLFVYFPQVSNVRILFNSFYLKKYTYKYPSPPFFVVVLPSLISYSTCKLYLFLPFLNVLTAYKYTSRFRMGKPMEHTVVVVDTIVLPMRIGDTQ